MTSKTHELFVAEEVSKFRLFVLLRQMVILNPEAINSKNAEMKQCARKLEEENLTGMERRGALLSYYCATGKSKLKAVQLVML
jgi:hypothetical protein